MKQVEIYTYKPIASRAAVPRRSHLEVESLVSGPVTAVTAQSWHFAHRFFIAVRHLNPCRTLQHATHKTRINLIPVITTAFQLHFTHFLIKIHSRAAMCNI